MAQTKPKSVYVYGDDSNQTICIRGDVEETYCSTWHNIEDEQAEHDVMVFSDGTVLEFYHNEGDPLYRLRALAQGPAFKGIQVGTEESDEAELEGEILWILVANKKEMLRV